MATLYKRDRPPGRVLQGEVVAVRDGYASEVHRIVAERDVTAIFQPIVHLDTRETVAFEALTRGPAGTPLEAPAALFAAAREANLGWELDTIARVAAFRTALDGHLPPSTSLFVNADPASVGRPVPADMAGTLAE